MLDERSARVDALRLRDRSQQHALHSGVHAPLHLCFLSEIGCSKTAWKDLLSLTSADLLCDVFSIQNAIWTMWVTGTTVGYGDIFPITHVGRIVAAASSGTARALRTIVLRRCHAFSCTDMPGSASCRLSYGRHLCYALGGTEVGSPPCRLGSHHCGAFHCVSLQLLVSPPSQTNNRRERRVAESAEDNDKSRMVCSVQTLICAWAVLFRLLRFFFLFLFFSLPLRPFSLQSPESAGGGGAQSVEEVCLTLCVFVNRYAMPGTDPGYACPRNKAKQDVLVKAVNLVQIW